LLNLGSHERDGSNIISGKFDLILHVGGTDVGDTLHEGHLAHVLVSQKVAHFDDVSGQGHVDGKVRINETHLVQESLGDTDEHVVNVGAHRSDAGKLLAGGEPEVDPDALLGFTSRLVRDSDLLEVHGNVLEFALEDSAGARDSDATGLDLNLDCWFGTQNGEC
jgi:hypothetical protein